MIKYRKHIHPTSNEWITFLHGAGASSAIWYKQIRFFADRYNVLLIDLRGHGESKQSIISDVKCKYTFPEITKDVIEVLEFEKIEKSHFAGISLGTIIIRQIAETCPEKVISMIMGGAVLEFNMRAKILLFFGNIIKSVVPYLFLYKIFAFAIMPKHKKTRNLFINEASKIYNNELRRLFTLTIGINAVFKFFRKTELPIPTIYLMGEDDYMFLSTIKKLMQNHTRYSQLVIVPNSGHVVNIDNPEFFNNQTLIFLKNLAK